MGPNRELQAEDFAWRSGPRRLQGQAARDGRQQHPQVHHPAQPREAASWREVPGALRHVTRLRRVMYLRMFWRPSHAQLPLAAAGVLIARRSPLLGALCLAPYLNLRVGWRHQRARRVVRHLAALPIWVAIDGIEIVSRLPAAVRHQ